MNPAEQNQTMKLELAELTNEWFANKGLPYTAVPDETTVLYQWTVIDPAGNIRLFQLHPTTGVRIVWELPERERRTRFFMLLEKELYPRLPEANPFLARR